MVFSSILFLFFFLPALLLCYSCLPRRFRAWRNGVLLAFSLFFYACGGLYYLPILLCSIAVNYLCGLLAAPGRPHAVRRAGLWAAIVLGLGMLGWFKYAGFLSANLSRLGVRLERVCVAAAGRALRTQMGSFTLELSEEQSMG